MDIAIRPISIQLVAEGTATKVVLKVPRRRKSSTRGQALLSHRGQTSRCRIRESQLRCIHSPMMGSGHTVHQVLPPIGTSTTINAESHSTHTIMGPALRPETLVPNRPARMINQNTPSMGSVRFS